MGTAFSYQGRLVENGTPVQGVVDLQFALYADLAGSTLVAGPVLYEDVPVANGVFTIALDFGANAFTGAPRWLEMGVRPGASTGGVTLLGPRQPLTPAPYALTAATVAVGAITNSHVAAGAGIATSKLSGPVTAISGHGLGTLATASSVSGGTGGTITDGTITNADVASNAAIATSKLSGAVSAIPGHGLGALAFASTVAGGTGGTIADGTITNADLAPGAFPGITGVGSLTDLSVSGDVVAATASSGNLRVGNSAERAKLAVHASGDRAGIGLVTTTALSTQLTGSAGTTFLGTLRVGDVIIVESSPIEEARTIASIQDDHHLTVTNSFVNTHTETYRYRNPVAHFADASGNDSLVVDPWGFVGIGTRLPDTPLQIMGGSDANYSRGSGYLQLGDFTNDNLLLDTNEILARHPNGSPGILYLNAGGTIRIPIDTTVYSSGSDLSPEVYKIDDGEGPIECNSDRRGGMFLGTVSGASSQDALCVCMNDGGTASWFCFNP